MPISKPLCLYDVCVSMATAGYSTSLGTLAIKIVLCPLCDAPFCIKAALYMII